MPIRYEPPVGPAQALTAFAIGAGTEAKRRKEIERTQRVTNRQRLADSLGGALGDIGGGYFEGRNKRALLELTSNLQREREIDRILVQDYGIAGLKEARAALKPGETISDLLAQRKADLEYQRTVREMAKIGFQPGDGPAGEARIRELGDSLVAVQSALQDNKIDVPTADRETERIKRQIQGIAGKSWVRIEKPRTIEDAQNEGTLYIPPQHKEDVIVEPGARGGYHASYIRKQQGKEQKGFYTVDEFLKAKKELTVEGQAPPSARRIHDYLMAGIEGGRTGQIPETAPLPIGTGDEEDTTESLKVLEQAGRMFEEADGQAGFIPQEGPNPANQPLMEGLQWVRERLGDDPKEWPKPVLAKAKQHARILLSEMIQRFGDPPDPQIVLELQQTPEFQLLKAINDAGGS